MVFSLDDNSWPTNREKRLIVSAANPGDNPRLVLKVRIPWLWPAYRLYEWHLKRKIIKGPLPRHVAIILDGNRRYAKTLGLNPRVGHSIGAEKVDEVLDWCRELGIPIITLYAFSNENWSRNPEEVEGLMKLIAKKFDQVVTDPRVHRYKMRVKAIGRIEKLPENVQRSIRRAEEVTKDYDGFLLNVAVGYGGRAEIVDAVQKICREVKKGLLFPEEVTEEVINKHLYTHGLPDPDLIIRTSGEERLSNFLLWQSAYSELYFCETFWPTFRKIDLLRAIRTYQNRERRFGV